MADLTAERLRELLDYDRETGIFTHRLARSGVTKGARAGTRNGKGYIQISVDGKIYQAHRLAVLYVTGSWPEDQTNHRNLGKDNNSWNNLRDADNSRNMANRTLISSNTSGRKGVHWDKRRKLWQVRVAGKYVGRFRDLDVAGQAYAEAARNRFGEFARVA